MSNYRHRRTSTSTTPFPNPVEPGEIVVNTANRQIAVGDAQAGVLGAPLTLLAIRVFDARASYATNDWVVQAGVLYRANGAIAPGAFNSSQWTQMSGTQVLKAGDTMTGDLTIANASTNSTLLALNNSAASGRSFALYSSGGGPAVAGTFGIYDTSGGGNRLTINSAGVVNIPGTTASTSTSTGALTVAGGVGIAGAARAAVVSAGALPAVFNAYTFAVNFAANSNLICTGKINLADGIALSSLNDAGGGYVGLEFLATAYRFNSNGAVAVASTTASTSPTTGALTVAGGVGVGGALITGGALQTTSGVMGNIPGGTGGAVATLTLNGGSASGGGAHIVLQRNAVAKWVFGTRGSILGNNEDHYSLYNSTIGETLVILATDNSISFKSTVASSSTTTGALTVAGGLGVAGALYLGGSVFLGLANAQIQINATTGTPVVQFRRAGAITNQLYNDSVNFAITSNAGSTAGMTLANGANAWTTISDARLPYKRSAREITDDLPSLDAYRLFVSDERVDVFPVAQDVAKIFPQIVKVGDDDPDYIPERITDPRAWSMAYDRLGAIALAYARQHQERLERIEQTLELT